MWEGARGDAAGGPHARAGRTHRTQKTACRNAAATERCARSFGAAARAAGGGGTRGVTRRAHLCWRAGGGCRERAVRGRGARASPCFAVLHGTVPLSSAVRARGRCRRMVETLRSTRGLKLSPETRTRARAGCSARGARPLGRGRSHTFVVGSHAARSARRWRQIRVEEGRVHGLARLGGRRRRGRARAPHTPHRSVKSSRALTWQCLRSCPPV